MLLLAYKWKYEKKKKGTLMFPPETGGNIVNTKINVFLLVYNSKII